MSTASSQKTRRAILGATRALVEDEGPQRWTMEDVAERAGVTRMTVYRHFASRTQLLIATVRHVDEDEGSVTRFAVVADCASGVEALQCWVDAWADYVPHIHPVARALLSARDSDPDAAEAWADRATALRRSTQRVTQWLHRDGVLAEHLTVDTATDLMWAFASVQVWEALTQEQHWPPERYRRELTTALRRVLLGAQPPGHPCPPDRSPAQQGQSRHASGNAHA